jgi:hypothetical protein
MADSEQHIYRHQVVNHSVGFATFDHVRQNNTRGLINTNIVEGMWADVKREMAARHRTKAECPYRLMEYLWRHENKGHIWEALLRGLGEVSFPERSRPREGEQTVFEQYRLITEEEGSEEQLDGDPTEEMNDTHGIDGTSL